MITINRTLPILLCAAWLLAGYGTGASATITPQVPRFISSSCPFPVGFGLAAGKTVRCGYLIVPEDRTKPNGRTIKLAVAIFKSPVQHPAPDPVIYLAGGPGDPALSGLGQALTVTNESDVVGDRDLLLIDQRGTGYSQPSLACPAAAHLIQVPPQPVGKELASLDSAYRQCHDRLVHDGIDLSAYNTVENAADVADLRKTLGYRTVNLYGVSYGTRLALTVMRDYPQGIRSVVLDSVVPPRHDYAARLRSIEPAFTTLFHGCAQAPNCSHEFPHLLQVFDQEVAHLDAKPLRVKDRSEVASVDVR